MEASSLPPPATSQRLSASAAERSAGAPIVAAMGRLDQLLAEWLEPPHDGYRDGEIPRYGQCPDCDQPVRSDRSDLLAEHAEVCAGSKR